MDGETFRAELESTMETELNRLGSGKLLVALTGADLSEGAVVAAVAGRADAAARALRAWAEDEPNAAARAAFEAAAEREAEAAERAIDASGGVGPDDGEEVAAALSDVDGTPERVAAGLVARPLVAARTYTQVVSFFINEADERRADVFRDLRSESEAGADEGVALLEEVCAGDDWERAAAAAEGLIRAAYDEYAGALEALGLDPKPVC